MTEATADIPSPGPSARGGVTLKDVAQASGVSISTASRALANNPRVSKETRRHVQSVARELNYVVNGLAQSMIGTGRRTVAFVTDAFLAEPFARIARGVDEVMCRHDALLLLNATHHAPERRQALIELFAQQRTSGVILVGTQNDTTAHRGDIARYHAILQGVGARLVLCGASAIPELDDIPTVAYDQCGGTRNATITLLNAGHRRIAFLGYAQRTTAMERFAGYQQAMRSAGIPVDLSNPLVITVGNVSSQIMPAIRRILDQDASRRPTAMVCITDHAALCVYRVAQQLGLHLPQDLSITGFDDLSSNDVLAPALSSVAVPFEAVGRYAARLVLGLPVEHGDHPVFPVRFTARGSIAAPYPQAD
ncbi:periplasmic binding protein and sugar binding domain of the LacI family protein [Bifidobacterium margollesii]|uniref:Periplasmic binding protein and sugar binding domain of the LacI family protein n=1 Tax=Bifidobacterium margollesii TaxID=2020964 RepID=A0A2N5JBS5_9BIFI|nr:LacI family DNA-binding transcriptional regulator [Bifidobacterium margollesii]PLS31655.1 periplasmic binding protein and sugar binding domain of the LacI family protein [Bifidobacterium margollesii]